MPKRYILVLVIIAVVFFGGIALIVSILRGGNRNEQVAQTAASQTVKKNDLSSDGAQVQYTQIGSVVGEEDRRSIRITVTPSERKIEIIRGYNEEVISSKSIGNNVAAFQAFTIALESAGFTSINPEIKTDEKASCVTGVRYAYDVSYTSGDKQRSWSSSCGNLDGNFSGNRGLVATLFRDQIPDYNRTVSGVRL